MAALNDKNKKGPTNSESFVRKLEKPARIRVVDPGRNQVQTNLRVYKKIGENADTGVQEEPYHAWGKVWLLLCNKIERGNGGPEAGRLRMQI